MRRSLAVGFAGVVAAVLGTAGIARAQVLEAEREEGGVVDGGLPVQWESIRVSIDQQHADTTLEQQFVNQTGARLEGRYLLTLGEGARVNGFAYWNGETKIVGEVFEKEVAREVYEEVTGLRRDPGLLEQVGEGAFTFRVFPIEPDEKKRIEVRYGRRLPLAGGRVEYRAPVAGKGTVTVDIVDAREIASVISPSHEISVRREKGVMKVEAEIDAKGAGKDFVLIYEVVEKDWTVNAVFHRDAGHDGYVAISIAAPADLAKAAVAAKDVTIVIDHSGSMAGEPLAQAKDAAAAVVARLRPEDGINVIQFDDDAERLFGHPMPATAENKAAVLEYIKGIRDGGGTNIAGALRKALEARAGKGGLDGGDDGRPFVVLFMTDGQSDTREALKAARDDQGDARVFTVGLGSGVEKPLLSRLAAEKRGRFTYIADAAAIESGVSKLFDQIESPVLLDLALSLDGARLERVYPRTLPDLVRGEELVVYGRIGAGQGWVPAPAARPSPDAKLDTKSGTVTIRGHMDGKDVSFSTELAMPATSSHRWVGGGWASVRVDDLLEQVALEGETQELTNETIELALAYNLVTPYTSFLAIPESELTEGAREAVESARERKKQIQAAHADAVALSRDEMPPGDPVLEVRAPSDAQQVTAYFPFGLVQDLTWDPVAEKWRTRFLVPKDVVDGVYEAQVVIVRADGTIELASAKYTIDSTAPGFDVEVEEVKGGLLVRVTPEVVAGRVSVAVVGKLKLRAELTDRGDGVFEGIIAAPHGKSDLRIVVADKARNEAEMILGVER
jgi:Ca-activated chloride channel homolog